MDPNACLDAALDAIFNDCDYEEGADRMADLQEWLSKGGFNPEFTQARGELMIECIAQLVKEAL